MTTEQATAVQAWASVAAAALAIVLTILTAMYVLLTRRLAESSGAQTSGSAHERIYNQNHAVLTVMATYPATRPFFYNETPLSACSSQEDRDRVLMIAEMYAGLLEQIALHLPGLPGTVRGQWQLFICDAYRLSPAIQHYFRYFGQWYSPVLVGLLPAGAVNPGAVGEPVR